MRFHAQGLQVSAYRAISDTEKLAAGSKLAGPAGKAEGDTLRVAQGQERSRRVPTGTSIRRGRPETVPGMPRIPASLGHQDPDRSPSSAFALNAFGSSRAQSRVRNCRSAL